MNFIEKALWLFGTLGVSEKLAARVIRLQFDPLIMSTCLKILHGTESISMALNDRVTWCILELDLNS